MAWCVSVILLLSTIATSANAAVFILANGDKINGEIVRWDASHVVIDHPQLGRIDLSIDQLAMDSVERPTPGLFGSNFLRGWVRHIDVGLTGSEGNDRNLSLTTGLEFSYEDDFKRWLLRGRTFFALDGDGISDNNATFDLRRDWLLPESRWFGRAQFRYQYDAFESWENRLILSVGPGFRLVEREAHTLDIFAGPSFTREFGDRGTSHGEATVGFDHHWKVNGRVTMHLANNVFYDFTSGDGGIRNVTLGELKLKVTDEPEVSLNVGAENEYESRVEPGDANNDVKYRVSLGLGF